MIPRTLDRYILRQWLKIFTITTIGFPLVVILIELTDKLDEYLLRDLDAGESAFHGGHRFVMPGNRLH